MAETDKYDDFSPSSEEKIDITFKEEPKKTPIRRKKAVKAPVSKKAKPVTNGKDESSRILLIILVLLIVAAGVYLLIANYKYLKPAGNATTTVTDAVAWVNGKAIGKADLESIFEKNPQIASLYTKEEVLERLIDQELLLQEAAKGGYEATTGEVDQSIELLAQAMPPGTNLSERLAEQNMTMEELRGELIKQISIAKLLNETVISKIAVTQEEIRQYYDAQDLENITFEQAAPTIEELISLEKQRLGTEDYLQTLREKATINNTLAAEPVDEEFASCVAAQNVAPNTIIFLHEPKCGYSTQMLSASQALNQSGNGFLMVDVLADAETPLMSQCLEPLLKDLAVPQFVCARTGAVLRGNQPEADFKAFVEKC